MVRTVISGTGVFIPANIISNSELVESFNEFVNIEQNIYRTNHKLEKSDERFIFEASGIGQRHVLEKSGILDPRRMVPFIPERPDDQLSVQAEFAVRSAESALDNARKRPAQIDLVICACAHHQRPYPAIAIEIQNALGCGGAAFDMNVACSSSLFALHVASSLIKAEQADTILVANPEIMSGHVNFRDRQTHFIFGDASAAIVLERKDIVDKQEGLFEIVDSRVETSFSNNIRSNFGFLNRADPSSMNTPDKLVTQVGRKVFRDVTAIAARFVRDQLDALGIDSSDLKRLWLHQANARMNDTIGSHILGRPANPDEMPLVLHKYGNTASPGSIISFHENNDDFEYGDLGLICSFGAGYSIGSAVLKRI